MLTTEFLITSLIVVLIPGTGVIYTVTIGLFMGARASFFAALGCTAGIIPHLLASTLGLAAILHMSALVFQVIKFMGAAYLLYLAWSMWCQAGALQLNDDTTSRQGWQISLKGFLLNILNPKLSLFFLAFLPQFIPTATQNPIPQLFFLGAVFMLMTLLVFILYGLFANSVRVYVTHSPRIMRFIQRSFAGVFALLGAKLALSER